VIGLTPPWVYIVRAGFALSQRFSKNLWTDRDSAARPQLVSVRNDVDAEKELSSSMVGRRFSVKPPSEHQI
jgi:hypothetical protein